ncbi:CAP domain-containing protein [Jiella pelagia]|uniref:CAP domain-containing protein n=1 Tax=Jiella pelagia TaxID=2986949 RepID=A0ABY7C1M9_9HYPH|nr:CAP domain-containing protein [Jiella pelagia]WAP68668.1 CAP domain-containing protein [Jiella pelagia]
MITAAEQYLVELINRARLDPQGEADRYLGGNLDANNTGAPFGTFSRQPLAVNEALNTAAAGHSQHMLAVDMFEHEGIGDGTATERMVNAGYPQEGSWGTGENISVYGSTGTIDLNAQIENHHEGLFQSIGHRRNILKDEFRELGVGQEAGVFSGFGDGITYNASMLTENFAYSGSRYFLTGVVYDDLDSDGFYSIGEGTSGRQITAGAGSATSALAGGYDIAVTPSSGFITVTSGSPTPAVLQVEIGTRNVKLDFIGSDAVAVSANAVLVSGISEAHLLGTDALNLTGSNAAERLVGNAGANILTGNGGNDLLRGGDGADDLGGGAGNDTFLADADGVNDSYDGGGDIDTMDYSSMTAGLSVNLFTGKATSAQIGTDTLVSVERVLGGSGNDAILGNGATRLISGNGGSDLLTGGAGANVIFGGLGNDTLRGLGGNDILVGGLGSDVMEGGAGNDTFLADADGANDRYDGGANIDTMDFSAMTAGLTVNLVVQTATSTQIGSDILTAVERVLGGGGNDAILGNASTVLLSGNGGADA